MQQQEDERGGAVLAGGQQRPQVQGRPGQEQEIQTLMMCKLRNIDFISLVKAVSVIMRRVLCVCHGLRGLLIVIVRALVTDILDPLE